MRSTHVFSGFDGVMLAIPNPQAHALLQASSRCAPHGAADRQGRSGSVLDTDAGFSASHRHPHRPAVERRPQHPPPHRLLARESSKPRPRGASNAGRCRRARPGRSNTLEDDAPRIQAKMLKAFSEVTGVRAEPSHAEVHRWRYAQTTTPAE